MSVPAHGVGLALARRMQLGAEAGLRLAAEEIAREYARNVPRGDPALDPDPEFSLRDAVTVEEIQTPLGPGYRVTVDGAYAAVVEFSHYHHPNGEGHPLERAVATVAPRMHEIIATAVSGRMLRA